MTAVAPQTDERGRGLPEGWRWVRLGDHVTKVGSGLTPLGGATAYVPSGVPLIRSQNVRLNRFDPTGLVHITASQDRNMSGSRVVPGDVLLNITGASIGRVCVVPRELCPANVNQHVCIIRSDGSVWPAYLSFYVSTPDFQQTILEIQGGATRQALTKALIEDFVVPLPPLREQQLIAAILSEQIAAVERARAAAEAQLEAAKALPAAYLRAVFESEEARAWPVRPLGQVGDIVAGVALGRNLNRVQTRPVPYLRVANVKDGLLDTSDVYDTPATEAEITRCRLRYGDLLLTEGGDPDKLGRGSFWADQISECIHQNHIFRVRFDLGQFSPAFLSAQIGSPYGKAYFLAHAKQTTGIATINQKVLSAFPMMSPPLSEQVRVAACLSEQIAVVERLRAADEAQADALGALPTALLRRAFGGEL